jgi:pilus assembly protein CpaC
MRIHKNHRALLGTALAGLIATGLAAAPAPAAAQTAQTKPVNEVALSVGTGRLVRLDGAMNDLFIANPGVADVQVRSSNQIYIFGKAAGETTVYATNNAGRVVYSATVRVGQNIGSIDEMLKVAMPHADIQVMPMNGFVLLTGTVATPADVEDASRLVEAFVGTGTQVMSRLKTATPLQVMLKVTIAEVSRSLTRNVGVNFEAFDATGGFNFAMARGRDFINDQGQFVRPEGVDNINIMGKLLGLNITSALDLSEQNGLVTVLAEPTLVALSGETASFLAGGEFPIPIAQGLNSTSIEFKQYGVSLSFSPTVLESGRISMRVRPEVSEISSEGAVTLGGFEIPGLTTRRTETTVELGSGQSFMIGGLLRNNGNNSMTKTPFLGSLPVIGALFRSNAFRRNETELVIMVTPYLVKPVSASRVALPTDGFRTSPDADRLLLDSAHTGRSGETRPGPVMATPRTATPQLVAPAPAISASTPAPAAAKPGFGF